MNQIQEEWVSITSLWKEKLLKNKESKMMTVIKKIKRNVKKELRMKSGSDKRIKVVILGVLIKYLKIKSQNGKLKDHKLFKMLTKIKRNFLINKKKHFLLEGKKMKNLVLKNKYQER